VRLFRVDVAARTSRPEISELPRIVDAAGLPLAPAAVRDSYVLRDPRLAVSRTASGRGSTLLSLAVCCILRSNRRWLTRDGAPPRQRISSTRTVSSRLIRDRRAEVEREDDAGACRERQIQPRS
jgi:hypothetical protein